VFVPCPWDAEQRRMAITCCALLSQHECCGADIGTKVGLYKLNPVDA
jgi:hypothetical protein